MLLEGERILWEHLGGVPNGKDDDIAMVKIRACIVKGYNSTNFEEAVLESFALDFSSTEKAKNASKTTENIPLRRQYTRKMNYQLLPVSKMQKLVFSLYLMVT